MFTDTENNQYAGDAAISKLVCDKEIPAIDIVCEMLFGRMGLTKNEYTVCKALFRRMAELNTDKLLRYDVFDYISQILDINTRSIYRYLNTLASIGVIILDNGYIYFTKFYDPMDSKVLTADYILIEVNPGKTSAGIVLSGMEDEEESEN